ncbi:hypothetical protein TcBrA4_0126220 [Trypanosoma cruzi]|nr:hypothetical protein TcBrA4_0126220 [Trypanosoma cruzi]
MRVRAAAMTTAVSVVATCAAGHCLSISAYRSGAALFCIASHRQSDEDMVSLLPGNRNLRIQSRPLRLLDTTAEQLLNFDYARFHRYKADHATSLTIEAVRTSWCVPSHHAILFD